MLVALIESKIGHTMLQVFLIHRDCACIGHVSEKSQAGDNLLQIFQLVGVTRHMIMDGAKELT